MTALVEGKGLSFSYGDRPVLRDVDLALSAGEFVSLVGPNGAGKSTLLHTLLGLLQPSAGAVSVGGRPQREQTRRDIARQVAFVPQDIPTDFAFTVRELVAMGRTPHLGRFQPERRADIAAIDAALAATGLSSFEDRLVSELSGGERQRVHLARAIAQDTAALFLDEPTANLDVEHQLEVLTLVRRLVRGGKGALVAIHDLMLAARYSDRIVLLAEEHIVASGPPHVVITEAALAQFFHIRARVFTVESEGENVLMMVPEGRTR
jgi:iron complex transport system ATP-binding protein